MVVVKEYSTAELNIKPVQAVPFTPEAFAPFGGLISPEHQLTDAQKESASAKNPGTPVKLAKIAPMTNNYAQAKSQKPAAANWNLIRASPPKLTPRTTTKGKSNFQFKILERHPYTTQAFAPMGIDAKLDAYLVIVAPTADDGLPDYNKVAAFVCKGNQAVTYGVNVWHAPIVALGDHDHVDFAVQIYSNGVAEEDVLEVKYNPGITIEL
ncbi:unnamed protein product [Ambrosiozyma monospora]|uniref:Unnamed protein product n=1 Tax=Ambrosiozyma monospora TaxID=43982 RepID=A0ACB5T388_AMBMO|nr:unnamed protein product [Ambrosiozyma monospora]